MRRKIAILGRPAHKRRKAATNRTRLEEAAQRKAELASKRGPQGWIRVPKWSETLKNRG